MTDAQKIVSRLTVREWVERRKRHYEEVAGRPLTGRELELIRRACESAPPWQVPRREAGQ